jgi:hypothetical protein
MDEQMMVIWWTYIDGRRHESVPMPAGEAEMRLKHLRGIGCLRIENSGVETVPVATGDGDLHD